MIPRVSALVTGVGYLGAPLVQRLLTSGERVVGLDNGYSTPSEALARVAAWPGFTLLHGDVANARDVTMAFDAASGGEPVAVVYHLAAQPSAALAAREPELTERSNLTGARVVLETAHERGARVVFGGSFRVYGDDLEGATIGEDHAYGRVSDLSHLSKLYVEQLARMLGVRFVSVRLGVVYGCSPIMKREPAFMTVPHLFCRNAATGQTLRIVEDRAMGFVHVDDAVDALLAADQLLGHAEAPWLAVNAVSEALTIGAVAGLVRELARARGLSVTLEGSVAATPQVFQVKTRLAAEGWTGRRRMPNRLGDVLDDFVAHAA
jgi:nucleoside-diphosphate-sugar epimerase